MSEVVNKRVFEAFWDEADQKFYEKQSDDNKRVRTEFAVQKPTHKDQEEAQLIYSKYFKKFTKADCFIRAELDNVLRNRNLWDEEKQKRFEELTNKISENIELAQKGKNKEFPKGGVKLETVIQKMIDVRMCRSELARLNSDRSQLDQNTAEAQAENVKFNYMVSCCTVYNDKGTRYFKDYDDYIKHDEDGDEVVRLAGNNFFRLWTGLNENVEKELPENKFLLKWKRCDEKLQLVNKAGKLIDIDGKLINEEGRYVDEKGNFINYGGEPVTKEGQLVNTEFVPFLDDDGNPIGDTSTETSKDAGGVKEELVAV